MIDDTDGAIDKLFTLHRPLGPIAVPDRASTSALRVLYDSQVQLHLRSADNPPTFIVGRRGSGKTALLLSRELVPGNLVIRLSTRGVFALVQSAAHLIGSQMVLTVEGVADLWEMLLWTPIIARLVRSERQPDVDPERALQILWEETALLRREIATSPCPDDAGLDYVTQRLIEHIKNGGLLISLEQLNRSFRLAHRPWNEVIRAAREILAARRTPVFVLIDSLENMGEHLDEIRFTLQGLFHLVGQMGLQATTTPRWFRIQCCFPSEMWPWLDKLSANPVKDFGGRLLLRWHWQDLRQAVGSRLRTFLMRHYPEYLKGIPVDDHERLLDRVIVPTLTNPTAAPEHTIAYVLRHTQLLPRQVLYIFGSALHRAIATTGRPLVLPDMVVDVVREAEATLCPEIFSAHHVRHPMAHDVARRLIPYLPFQFDDGYLHRMCNRAAIKADFGLDYREVREMFTDVGILGRYMCETERYVQAQFAYSVEGQVTLSPEEDYCLHPLFVRQYNSRDALPSTPNGKPVYPYGTPLEKDLR